MFKFKKYLLKKNKGIETVEVVIILVILVAIGFAFRNVIIDWYNYLVNAIETNILSSPNDVPYGQ